MSLPIPNTTTLDVYTQATTFPPEQGAGTPFASGYIVIANNPATISVLRGTGQGSASWGADFSFTPTTLPLSAGLDPSTGQIRDFIFGVRFKSAIAGSPAQVFGGLFQLGDVTLSPANQFTGTLGAGGTFIPPGSNMIAGTVTAAGVVASGTGFSVIRTGLGTYQITLTTPIASPVPEGTSQVAGVIIGMTAASTTIITVSSVDWAGGAGTFVDAAFQFSVQNAS